MEKVIVANQISIVNQTGLRECWKKCSSKHLCVLGDKPVPGHIIGYIEPGKKGTAIIGRVGDRVGSGIAILLDIPNDKLDKRRFCLARVETIFVRRKNGCYCIYLCKSIVIGETEVLEKLRELKIFKDTVVIQADIGFIRIRVQDIIQKNR